jgi:hypothetical protein
VRTVPAYLWALPTTLVGLLFLPFVRLTGGGYQVVAGVLELHGGLVAWMLEHATLLPGGALAMTLGHVILGRNRQALELTRAHEHVHVRQAERWGPLFIPAYLLASAAIWLLRPGGDAYLDNPFERQARREAGE